ncbi:winged helix-turn-helix transcriptional regulator [Arthrobacter sp. 24S4-2]|uniref:MarR family winged helix-turn-helix transcriptional regulator n=1 Tax=Arthrobacter sp. 24S4-2 TaxID=2575374 RepID=UPI0010C7BA1C|nr:MarR family winged helix-turn-helix transcriptional regulator [Arthrobacter sp. 24S4-2]QCO98027.1 winged helix-turn-helix transcriptional regulator [Arthrobacter sp. 24S4-2]
MSGVEEFGSGQEAANDYRVLAFGRLLGAANRLEHLLGRDLEEEFGISHSIFELLLLAGRAGSQGIPVRDIAQARVLTSGGATRLVQRASALGLIERENSASDARIQLIRLSAHGEDLLLRASTRHVENIERHLLNLLSPGEAEVFSAAVKKISKHAARELPIMP